MGQNNSLDVLTGNSIFELLYEPNQILSPMRAHRYIFVIGFIFLFMQPSAGQGYHHSDSVDYWKQEVVKEQDPGKKTSLYYKLLDHYYYSDFDSAYKYTYGYIGAAEDADQPLLSAYGYYYIADLHTVFKPDSALAPARKYFSVAKSLGDSVWIADAYGYIAESYWLRGVRDSALYYYERGLTSLEGANDTMYLSRYLNNFGYFLSFGVQQLEGLEYFIEAIELAIEVSDTMMILNGYHNLAYYYERIGELSKAYFYFNESLRLLPSDEQIGEHALTYYALADLNMRFNNREDAMRQLWASKSRIVHVYPTYQKTELLLNYADLHFQLSQLDSAVYYLEQAEKILRNYENFILYGYYYQVMGMISQYEKDHAASIGYFRQSNQMFEKSASKEPLEKNYSMMALSYEALGNYTDAYRYKILSEELIDDFDYGRIAMRLAQFENDQQVKRDAERMQLELKLERKSLEAASLRDKANLRYAIIAGLFLILLLIAGSIFYLALRRKNKVLREQFKLISSQKDQLSEAIAKLEASERQLKELNASKDKFFSIISHDLRNPLSAIIGLSELFLEEKDLMQTKDLVPIFESMYSTANYGFNLLENLLEWARSQTGAIEPKPEKVSIEEIVANIKKDFQTITNSKGVIIICDEEPPPPVEADRNMVQTILRNLIHNAIKYSNEDGTIIIHWRVEEGTLITSVKDQGIGMTEEELAGIFNLDKKVQRLGTADEKGTGLGLILCNEFVSKNHGKIWAESAEGAGAVFYFSLPLMNVEA